MQTLAPVLKYYLKHRLKRGKEDPVRLYERFGGGAFKRPAGKIIWFHAASVGESLSILKLIDQLLYLQKDATILVTTGTVTSAKLLGKMLPHRCIHQFIPLDVPFWVKRFLTHWQPNLAIFIESELWPNLIRAIKKQHIPLLLLNARISRKSFQYWRYLPFSSKKILEAFDACFTSSTQSAHHLRKLGAPHVYLSCNLKFGANKLEYKEEEFNRLKNICEKRIVWAATSTHPGEEEIIFAVHKELKEFFPRLLTILAPRHPNRASEIVQKIQEEGLTFMRRSQNEYPRQKTDLWVVDTLGDLGLVYSLARISFIGGSLVPIGGHNPLEALNLGSAIVMGPYIESLQDVKENLNEAFLSVRNKEELIDILKDYLSHEDKCQVLVNEGQKVIAQQQSELAPLAQKVLHYLK